MTNLSTSLLILLIFPISCIRRAEPEIHLIPKNYRGPVIIIYNEREGAPEKYEDDFRVYEIPSNGILRTQFKHPKGFIAPGKRQYYYWDKNRREQLSPIEVSRQPKDDGKPHIFGIESSVGTIRYLVGYLNEGDDYYNQLRKKIKELFPSEIQ